MLIRWIDGSYELSVGGELLDMDYFQCATEGGGEGGGLITKEFLYLAQKAKYNNEKGDDNNEDGGGVGGLVLECASVLMLKFIPRVVMMEPVAHKKFVPAEQKWTLKRDMISEIVTMNDPEREKIERIKDKTDLAKQAGVEVEGREGRRVGGEVCTTIRIRTVRATICTIFKAQMRKLWEGTITMIITKIVGVE